MKVAINLTNFIQPGEYEYYLTPESPEGYYIDINELELLESDIFHTDKLRPVFTKDGFIFAEHGNNDLLAGSVTELFTDMYIISKGIIQYKEPNGYFERNKEEGHYNQR